MTAVEELRLGELVPAALTITRGFPTQHGLAEGDVRVMSVAALRKDALPKQFATRDSLAELDIDVAQPGDVLVAIEGGTVGETLVVDDGLEEFVPSQQAATLRVIDPTRIDPWYLGAWLATEVAGEQLRRLARGAGIQRIPIKDLSVLAIGVPPMSDQREIADRFRSFETTIRSHRAVTACLEELRDVDLVLTFAKDRTKAAGPKKAISTERRRAARHAKETRGN